MFLRAHERGALFLIAIFSVSIMLLSQGANVPSPLVLFSTIGMLFIFPGFFLVDLLLPAKTNTIAKQSETPKKINYEFLLIPTISISLTSIVCFFLALYGMLERNSIIISLTLLTLLLATLCILRGGLDFRTAIPHFSDFNTSMLKEEPSKFLASLGILSLVMLPISQTSLILDGDSPDVLEFYVISENGLFSDIDFSMDINQSQNVIIGIESNRESVNLSINQTIWEISENLGEDGNKITSLNLISTSETNIGQISGTSLWASELTFSSEGDYRVELNLLDDGNQLVLNNLSLLFEVL